MKKIIFVFCIVLSSVLSKAQGLESIVVEKYYVATSDDVADTSMGFLPAGSVTYRIYVDMKSGYTLHAVYGDTKHELSIKTTTKFFNVNDRALTTGNDINDKALNQGTLALDSWVCMGAASMSHFGVPKEDDRDGSFLKNRGSLSVSDGYLKAAKITEVTVFGLDYLIFFGDGKFATSFSSKNGAWAAKGGVKGPTKDNKVLIAQLTTDGKLSFELNLQLKNPKGEAEKYVAKNPDAKEIKFDGLIFLQK